MATLVDLILHRGDEIVLARLVQHPLIEGIGPRNDRLGLERLRMPAWRHFRRHDALDVLLQVHVVDKGEPASADQNFQAAADRQRLGLARPVAAVRHDQIAAAAPDRRGFSRNPLPVQCQAARRRPDDDGTSKHPGLSIRQLHRHAPLGEDLHPLRILQQQHAHEIVGKTRCREKKKERHPEDKG